MNEIITRRATQGPVVPIPKRVPCRECGRRFEILCDHLSKKHKMMPGQYRERHGLTVDYPLQANEPPAPESAGHRIVEHVKDFSLGLFHGLTCRFELPLPEFSLWALHSTNRQDTKLIFEVWDYCDGSDIDVWVSAREFQASVILETGKGTRFRLIVFQFSKKIDMAICKLGIAGLW